MPTDISELQKLYVHEKEYKIPEEPKEGEEQITIKVMPLGMDEMSLFDLDDKASIEEQSKKMIELIAKSLGVGVETMRKVVFGYMTDIMNCISDANRIPVEDRKKMDNLAKFMEQRGSKGQ